MLKIIHNKKILLVLLLCTCSVNDKHSFLLYFSAIEVSQYLYLCSYGSNMSVEHAVGCFFLLEY